MDRSTFLLVLASVLLSCIAQIVLKGGMSSLAAPLAASQGLSVRTVMIVATNVQVLSGLAIYFASAVVWLLVLARIPVGFAYPFVGLGFVVTMLLAWLLRGETPSVAQVAGTLIICLGVVVLARA